MPINIEKSLSSKIAILLLCAGIISCRSAISVPSGIIELNRMKEIMWDLTQAEAYANQYIAHDSTKKVKPETLVLYQKIFVLHRITKEDFAASVQYYQSHPVKQKILLDSLLQYASRMKEKDQQKRYATPVTSKNSSIKSVAR